MATRACHEGARFLNWSKSEKLTPQTQLQLNQLKKKCFTSSVLFDIWCAITTLRIFKKLLFCPTAQPNVEEENEPVQTASVGENENRECKWNKKKEQN